MKNIRGIVLASLVLLAVGVIVVSCCIPETVVSGVPRFAYVGNEGSNNISAYTVDNSTGALAPVPGSAFAGPMVPRDAVVELFGRFLYVSNGGTNGVTGFSIDPTTGALSQISGSPFAGGAGPRGIALAPSGKFLYTADRNGNSVSGYTINTDTGALTPITGSPFAVAPGAELQPGPQQLTVDPSGRFLYVADHLTGDIAGFTINGSTGALTLISGSPFSDQPTQEGSTQPFGLVVAPSGKFLYVANHGSSTISIFRVNAATGALAPITGSPFAIPPPSECSARPFGAVISPAGQFLYLADNGCDAVSVFSLDATTGLATQTPHSPFFLNAGDCFAGSLEDSLDATGRFLYVANNGGCNNISAFSVDPATGDLTAVAGSPYPAGSGPYGVAVSRIN